LKIADALRDRRCKILVIFWNCKAPVLSFDLGLLTSTRYIFRVELDGM
jgi:hypothetical protein